jgi:hypothetical protein
VSELVSTKSSNTNLILLPFGVLAFSAEAAAAGQDEQGLGAFDIYKIYKENKFLFSLNSSRQILYLSHFIALYRTLSYFICYYITDTKNKQ